MKAFETGQTFTGMRLEDGEAFRVSDQNKEYSVKSIMCIMENGEMAAVPWFVVKYADGRERKINGKYVVSIS